MIKIINLNVLLVIHVILFYQLYKYFFLFAIYRNISNGYSIYSSIQVSNTTYEFSIITAYKKKDAMKNSLNIFYTLTYN